MYRLTTMALAVALPLGVMYKGCVDVDSDGDGALDDVDNCASIFNTSQADEDGDGVGDACDSSTPYHPMNVAGCFFSDWPPMKGVNWEQRPTLIEQGDIDPSGLFVSIDWTASDTSDWIERGAGSTNGLEVWYDTIDNHNPYNYTRTVVEGTALDTNSDGTADEFRGTFIMLVCDTSLYGEDCINDVYGSLLQDGEWVAKRVNSLECNNL